MINVVFISVRQAVVPGDLLGRVGSAQRFVTWGALPIGALLGGWLAEVSTLRVPYLVAAGIVAVTAAFLWRRLVDFPTQPLFINLATMRPDDSNGFRQAWSILERLWEGTVACARAFPEAALHRSVDGEWSFIQTLRHLNFASAAWVGRMILGNASPWHQLDLPWDEAPGWDGIPWDREARPSLDAVLTVRRERQAMVRHVMESLTDEQLASDVTRTETGWPRAENFPFKECLRIVPSTRNGSTGSTPNVI